MSTATYQGPTCPQYNVLSMQVAIQIKGNGQFPLSPYTHSLCLPNSALAAYAFPTPHSQPLTSLQFANCQRCDCQVIMPETDSVFPNYNGSLNTTAVLLLQRLLQRLFTWANY